MQDVVIVGAARTPMGSFKKSLSAVPAPELGAIAIKEALRRAGVDPEQVSQVNMGNILSAGIGQGPARQAMLKAGVPASAGAVTTNKLCGSGLYSVMQAATEIKVADKIIVAGGMENMSLAPHMLLNARGGLPMGEAPLQDSLFYDGLRDPYSGELMGAIAELCAEKYGITREQQDEYAVGTYRRALAAQKEGLFAGEIVPVEVPQRRGEPIIVDMDEEPGRADLSRFSSLRPVFKKNGTITPANASTINDGGAAVVVMPARMAEELGIAPLARILGYATHSQDPNWFTTAPADAIRKALVKAQLSVEEINLWEINEAFSVVALYNVDELKLDSSKVNVHGGAVALGHPVGASGARVLTTLLYAMKERRDRYGCASLCIGGGEAVAMVVELM